MIRYDEKTEKMMWLISKVVTQICNSSGNLQRGNLVLAVLKMSHFHKLWTICKFWTNSVLLPEAAVCR